LRAVRDPRALLGRCHRLNGSDADSDVARSASRQLTAARRRQHARRTPGGAGSTSI